MCSMHKNSDQTNFPSFTYFGLLTIFGLLPHNSFQIDAGARLTWSKTFWLGCQSCFCCVHCHRACANHDLLTRRRDVVVVSRRTKEVKRRRSSGGKGRFHLWEGEDPCCYSNIHQLSDQESLLVPKSITSCAV